MLGGSPNKKNVWINQSRLNVGGEQEPSLKDMIKTFLTDENHECPDDKHDSEIIVSPKRRGTILDQKNAGSASPSNASPNGRSNKRKTSMHQGGTKMSGNSIDYENS